MDSNYQEIIPAMQKAYNRTNMLRKISLFVSLGSIIVFFAIFFGFFMSSSKITLYLNQYWFQWL